MWRRINIIINTKSHQLIWNTKLLIKKSKRKLKNGNTLDNIWYEGALPQPLMDLIVTDERNLFFFKEKGKIYFSGQKPMDKDYEVFKVQKANRHYSIPCAFFNVSKKDSTIHLVLDLFLYEVCPCVEVSIF